MSTHATVLLKKHQNRMPANICGHFNKGLHTGPTTGAPGLGLSALQKDMVRKADHLCNSSCPFPAPPVETNMHTMDPAINPVKLGSPWCDLAKPSACSLPISGPQLAAGRKTPTVLAEATVQGQSQASQPASSSDPARGCGEVKHKKTTRQGVGGPNDKTW